MRLSLEILNIQIRPVSYLVWLMIYCIHTHTHTHIYIYVCVYICLYIYIYI